MGAHSGLFQYRLNALVCISLHIIRHVLLVI